jgi:hypothetical protein
MLIVVTCAECSTVAAAHLHRTAPLTGNDNDDQPRFRCLARPSVRPLRVAREPHARRPALVDPAADKRRLLLLRLGSGEPPDQRRHSSGAHLEGAGDLLRRPSASAELADTFQQFIIGHSTVIPDAGTPARRVRRDPGKSFRWSPSGAASREDSAEPLGAKRGIITEVEVDVTLERAIEVERGPAATAHVVALVGALP